MRQSLKKSERLKKRDDIQRLFKKGDSIFEHPIKLYHLSIEKGDEAAGLRFGVSVPKKKFKRAVDRNLLKRRIKEAYRKHNGSLKSLFKEGDHKLLIMPVFLADEIADYSLIEGKIILLLQRLQAIYEQDH
ncbi:MAG: ribonuclease P protein component [Flavobacteriales bacterium]|nr:ribonuclease P protein component [Flavobacteriales bacterium]|tara:strand:+ start:1335 stop:1727 length:393 start_codon:yes stop_codon:yes gene_type:complete